MICVFPFSLRDQDLALKNAQWINELGGCHGHEVVVCYDVRCAAETVEAIGQEMLKAFDKVYRLKAEAAIDGWPEGANYLFRLVSAWLAEKRQWPYFFWMEPDAIPLSKGWLDVIEEAHKHGGKPFTGDRVEVRIADKEVPLHMSGIAVYPNPIYIYAGEAYRAAEVAWDMAAKDQIVPQANFTKLIEHAWQHPSFTSLHELETQIRPEAVIFHSSKDGSLIDLLQKKLSPGNNLKVKADSTQQKDREEPRSPGEIPHWSKSQDETMTNPIYDIFIRTYAPDYDWLRYCIQAIDKFASGFRKIWIVSPNNPPLWMLDRANEEAGIRIEWKIMNDETTDGYLAQQITKLYADTLTGYEPDYILHVDSDVIFTRPCTPQDFFQGERLIWYYTPYSAIATPWQPIMEKFMGVVPMPYEFMRRFPMMMPKWMYPKLREFAFRLHRQPIGDYIKRQGLREFSEFNALGCYAYFHHKEEFDWVDTTTTPIPQPMAKQFHSWSGITDQVKAEIETILRGGEAARSRADPGSSTATPGLSPSSPPSQIKVLSNGLWVLKGDQISEWVEQEGRLDHDQNFLPDILPHIKQGGTVIDIGAHIGDHTIAYARKAGRVFAFEPNPVSFQCLAHNLAQEKNDHVILCDVALGDRTAWVPLSGNNGQPGGGYIGEHMKVADVLMRPLDQYEIEPDFIKIDVEGYELNVLQGGEQTINTHHPVMVIEINSGALKRQGRLDYDIFKWLKEHDYGFSIIQKNCSWGDPLYDILCTSKRGGESNAIEKRKITEGSEREHPGIPQGENIPAHAGEVWANAGEPAGHSSGHGTAAEEPEPITLENLRDYIERLKAFADSSKVNKQMVMQRLVYAKLKEPNKYRKDWKKKQRAIPAIFRKKKKT